MPIPPRLQFPGAIDRIVTRGDGRRAVFHGDGHYDRFTNGLADEVQRSAWEAKSERRHPPSSAAKLHAPNDNWQ